ncbi:MAG: hypothetical protein BZ138_07740, partial [Methanosphaera sp. rholeuAM270]
PRFRHPHDCGRVRRLELLAVSVSAPASVVDDSLHARRVRHGALPQAWQLEGPRVSAIDSLGAREPAHVAGIVRLRHRRLLSGRAVGVREVHRDEALVVSASSHSMRDGADGSGDVVQPVRDSRGNVFGAVLRCGVVWRLHHGDEEPERRGILRFADAHVGHGGGVCGRQERPALHRRAA